MSSVKIQGSATGTANFTIAVPDGTSTDRTINLADEAGTFVTKDASNNISGVASVNGGQLGGTRNALINPSFSVAQRGSSGTLSGSSLTYVSDRWVHRAATAVGGTTTYSQDVANGATQLVLTYSGATSHAYIQQMIEAQNIYHLWGNEITISLYTTASNPTIRMYSYDASDTEETLLSDTALTSQGNNRWTHTMTLTTPSGGFKEGNGRALLVVFGINGLSTVADGTYKFWNTQMELGDTATDFEHENYGTTLQKCQRYYYRQKVGAAYDPILGVGSNWNTTNAFGILTFPVQMRTAPSGSASSVSDFLYYTNGVARAVTGLSAGNIVTNFSAEWTITGSGFVGGESGWVRSDNANAYIEYSAEL